MTTAKKLELLDQLAISMGNVSSDTKNFKKKYDESTGTLYCGGMEISKSTIEQAKDYFYKLMLRCSNSEVQEIKDAAIFYRLALDAIESLEDNNNVSSGR